MSKMAGLSFLNQTVNILLWNLEECDILNLKCILRKKSNGLYLLKQLVTAKIKGRVSFIWLVKNLPQLVGYFGGLKIFGVCFEGSNYLLTIESSVSQ